MARRRMSLDEAMNGYMPSMSFKAGINKDTRHVEYDVTVLKMALGAMRDAMNKRVKRLGSMSEQLQNLSQIYTDYRKGYYPIPSTKGYGNIVTADEKRDLEEMYADAYQFLTAKTSTVSGAKTHAARTIIGVYGMQIPVKFVGTRKGNLATPEMIMDRYKHGSITLDEYYEYNRLRNSLVAQYESVPAAVWSNFWDETKRNYDKYMSAKAHRVTDADYYNYLQEAMTLMIDNGSVPSYDDVKKALDKQAQFRKSVPGSIGFQGGRV